MLYIRYFRGTDYDTGGCKREQGESNGEHILIYRVEYKRRWTIRNGTHTHQVKIGDGFSALEHSDDSGISVRLGKILGRM
jgi:hypothetical protein